TGSNSSKACFQRMSGIQREQKCRNRKNDHVHYKISGNIGYNRFLYINTVTANRTDFTGIEIIPYFIDSCFHQNDTTGDLETAACGRSTGTDKHKNNQDSLGEGRPCIKINRRKSGGVFAKMTKPGQDLRIDIPAIGVDTVNAVASAKLRGIVVNTKTCFVVNKPAVIKRANELGIFILALDE
ncbi:MAG: LpxI family protein, partial [Alphaproteobacteria bacterium]|nr:LpxI family protein [Alphaproteobacteria bacterium]